MSSFIQVIDKAVRALIFTKFGDIMNFADVNTGVVLWPKDVALRKVSEKRGADVSEFANVWRTATKPSWQRMRTAVARTGINVYYIDPVTQEQVRNVKAQPVDLEYDMWFWSMDRNLLDLVSERYIFWQHANPNLSANYYPGGGATALPLEYDLHFGDIVDETDYGIFDKGKHHVIRMPITLDGWIFDYITTGTITSIRLCIYDRDNLEESQYEEIITDRSTSEYNEELADLLRLYESTITSDT
jgi:hypothetical protein